MAAERIYCVKGKPDENGVREKRLVRASHPSTALMHVARDTYETAVATQNDLEELLSQGIKVESIKAEQQQLPG